jgi:hypothetical protein
MTRDMARRARAGSVAVALLALVAACGDDDGDDAGADDEAAEAEVILEDDFSDPQSGFTTSQGETGSLAYVDEAYVIDSLGLNSLKVSDTDLDGEAFVESLGDLGDVRIEVDVAKAADEGTAILGVLCRLRVDPPAYYGAFFDTDGYWRITRFAAGTTAVLAEADATTLVTGLGGEDGDRLRFDCVDDDLGATLTLSLDGEEVGSALDPTPLAAGRAAMAAGTRGDGARGAARFDDLVITTLG